MVSREVETKQSIIINWNGFERQKMIEVRSIFDHELGLGLQKNKYIIKIAHNMSELNFITRQDDVMFQNESLYDSYFCLYVANKDYYTCN